MNNIIEIEISAEKIYYTVLGTEQEMQLFIKKINNSNYFSSQILVPLADIAFNKNLEIPEYLEKIQCSVLCDCKYKEERQLYMLLYKDNNKLSFPEIKLLDGTDPDVIIVQHMKKYLDKIPENITKTLKLVDIAGQDEDILVYSARLNKTCVVNKSNNILNK